MLRPTASKWQGLPVYDRPLGPDTPEVKDILDSVATA